MKKIPKLRLKGYNPFSWSPSVGQLFTEPSQTVPDDVMSMREILSRFARGMPYSAGQKLPLYDESDSDEYDELLGDPRKLDYAELADRREQAQQELAELRRQQRDSEAGHAATPATPAKPATPETPPVSQDVTAVTGS